MIKFKVMKVTKCMLFMQWKCGIQHCCQRYEITEAGLCWCGKHGGWFHSEFSLQIHYFILNEQSQLYICKANLPSYNVLLLTQMPTRSWCGLIGKSELKRNCPGGGGVNHRKNHLFLLWLLSIRVTQHSCALNLCGPFRL